MKRRLSSLAVPISKVWLVAIIGYVLYLAITDFTKVGLLGLIMQLGTCGVVFLIIFDWKNVYVEGNRLIVTRFRKRIIFPLADVVGVEPSRWSAPRTITLYLKSPSDFGSKIVFVPRLIGPSASELRELIAAQR